MKFSDVSVPEIYKESADFRFFLKWIELALSKVKYDTENLLDLYDPQRCPEHLLWMLGDTMGYKFDDRLPTAFNRLVMLYFMSMIHNKGSKNGVTLAAEVNLAQFSIQSYGKENDVLYNRLEDTSIPVNAAYVTPHPHEGYIDVVYFSAEVPTDACIEYVRPLGMYCFQHAGVRVDARTKISIDARLTDSNNYGLSIGPTRVGHYTRADYASLQQVVEQPVDFESLLVPSRKHSRRDVYYRNKNAEQQPCKYIDPGFRSLYSLQLCNNEHIVKSLIPSKDTGETVEPDPIFSLGYGPQDISQYYPDDYLKSRDDVPEYNLRYNRGLEESITPDVYTVDSSRTKDNDILSPQPAVNPNMMTLGDAISLNTHNTVYGVRDKDGKIVRSDSEEN